jgi:threonine dehydrogenase-like Zn-dependent dehydrogenase
MGHELSGEIVEVGEKVNGFRVGDRITGVGQGGFAEYVSVPVTERSPHILPEPISFEDGATLEPLATSLHGVSLGQPTAGETVVVLGTGIIGLGCIQAIRATVDCRIIAVDASERRLDMAKSIGADAAVNLTETDSVEAVIELTGGAKPVERFGVRGGNADLVIDCAGAPSSPNQGLLMLKQQYGRDFRVWALESRGCVMRGELPNAYPSCTQTSGLSRLDFRVWALESRGCVMRGELPNAYPSCT